MLYILYIAYVIYIYNVHNIHDMHNMCNINNMYNIPIFIYIYIRCNTIPDFSSKRELCLFPCLFACLLLPLYVSNDHSLHSQHDLNVPTLRPWLLLSVTIRSSVASVHPFSSRVVRHLLLCGSISFGHALAFRLIY